MSDRTPAAPTRKAPGQRPVLQFRVHPEMYDELRRSAEERSLTISEEAARRLAEYDRHQTDMAIAQADLARLREVVASSTRSIEMLGETHKGREQLLVEENERLHSLLNEWEELQNKKNIEVLRDELIEFGFKRIHVGGGVVWSEPEADLTAVATHLDTATLIGKLDERFVRALASEIAAKLSAESHARVASSHQAVSPKDVENEG